MLSIYDYSDYRQFIRDYYESKKAARSTFSLRYLSQKAGINSSAFFKFVMDGKRNLTKQSIFKVCVALGLKDDEAEYFERLVFFNQAKTIDEKNYFFNKLIEKQKLRTISTIHENQYEYFAQWYHPIIRELVTIVDFGNDFAKLACRLRPPITESEARKSVRLLIRLGFLKVQDGRYVQTEPLVTSGHMMRAHQIVKYQIEMLHHAIASFDRAVPPERSNSTLTISISKQMFASINRRMRQFRKEILQLAQNEDAPEVVYEFNMNLFPVSREPERSKGYRHK